MIVGIAGLPELTANYIEALRLAACRNGAGFSPAPDADSIVPHTESSCFKNLKIEVSLLRERAAGWDALILPGGGDIDPALLPGHPPLDPHCHDIDPALDRQQLALLALFIREQKPVLGICKGMQLICLSFGCNLCQHLTTAGKHRYIQHDQFHSSHAQKSSFLEKLYGSDFIVNSAHHQGILLRPGEIAAIQQADDGVIEGIVHTRLPIIGLQWHPERLCGRFARPDLIDGSLVFQHFLSLI